MKILEILNTRFLPYWSASPVASFRDALIKNDGVYRIGCNVSVISTESSASVTTTRDPAQKSRNSEQDFSLLPSTRDSLEMTEQRDSSVSLRNDKIQEKFVFEYSTARYGFVEVPYKEGMRIDEDYWLSDVLDFLEWRQEMYSSFWHRLDPKRVYRLWTCLGATYMNHDLVERKYRLHFEQARRGKTANDFVETVLRSLKKE